MDRFWLWVWRVLAGLSLVLAIVNFVDREVEEGILRLLLAAMSAIIASYRNDDLKRKASRR